METELGETCSSHFSGVLIWSFAELGEEARHLWAAWKEHDEAVFWSHEPVQLVVLTLLLEHFRASIKMPFGSPRLPIFAWIFLACVSLAAQPLDMLGIRLSPQTPLKLFLSDEIKPKCPKPPSSSPSHHTHRDQPLGQAYPYAQNWRNKGGWFSHDGGKQVKGCAISWDLSASCGFPAPPQKKCLPWRKYAHQRIPQILEHSLGTCDGTPCLGKCAALPYEAVNRTAVVHQRQKMRLSGFICL